MKSLTFIYDNHCHLVTEWNRDVLSLVALQQYAGTISRKVSPLNNSFDLIDGTADQSLDLGMDSGLCIMAINGFMG